MSESIQVISLLKRCDLIQELALWHQREWRASGRNVPVAQRVQRLRSHLYGKGLPNTWLALEAEKLVGSVSLVDYVFQNDSHRSAWVANLFVIPNRRQRGLGTRLLAHAEAEAGRHDLRRLFLFTHDRRNFYQQYGWLFSHRARVQGQWVDVMTKALNASQNNGEQDSSAAKQGYLPNTDDVVSSYARW